MAAPRGEDGFRGCAGGRRPVAVADVSCRCEIGAAPDAGHACWCFEYQQRCVRPGQRVDMGIVDSAAVSLPVILYRAFTMMVAGNMIPYRPYVRVCSSQISKEGDKVQHGHEEALRPWIRILRTQGWSAWWRSAIGNNHGASPRTDEPTTTAEAGRSSRRPLTQPFLSQLSSHRCTATAVPDI